MIDVVNTTIILSLIIIILIYTIKKSQYNLLEFNIDERIKKIKLQLDSKDDDQSKNLYPDILINEECTWVDPKNTTNKNFKKLSKRLHKKSLMLFYNYKKDINEYINELSFSSTVADLN